MGSFPPTSEQRRFILVTIDYLNKLIEDEALSHIKGQKCKISYGKTLFVNLECLKRSLRIMKLGLKVKRLKEDAKTNK